MNKRQKKKKYSSRLWMKRIRKDLRRTPAEVIMKEMEEFEFEGPTIDEFLKQYENK